MEDRIRRIRERVGEIEGGRGGYGEAGKYVHMLIHTVSTPFLMAVRRQI